jgi:ketosteroid isomerase-like protein
MVATVDAFGAALHAADLAKVAELLDDEVLVLESGGAERSKAQYLAEHAGADAEFLREAHVQQTDRRAHIAGDMGWVGTESEIHATRDGKPMTLLSTETMVLQRSSGGPWRIVHIHWSSRPKKERMSP